MKYYMSTDKSLLCKTDGFDWWCHGLHVNANDYWRSAHSDDLLTAWVNSKQLVEISEVEAFTEIL